MFATAMLAARLTHRATEVYHAACVLIVFAGFSRVVSLFLTPPWSMAFYPLQDALCAALCFGAYRMSRERWKLLLGLCFVVQCGIHAWFWSAGDDSVHALRGYILANNVFYAAELAVIFATGGGHVARVVIDRLRMLRPFHLAHHPHARGHR